MRKKSSRGKHYDSVQKRLNCKKKEKAEEFKVKFRKTKEECKITLLKEEKEAILAVDNKTRKKKGHPLDYGFLMRFLWWRKKKTKSLRFL